MLIYEIQVFSEFECLVNSILVLHVFAVCNFTRLMLWYLMSSQDTGSVWHLQMWQSIHNYWQLIWYFGTNFA